MADILLDGGQSGIPIAWKHASVAIEALHRRIVAIVLGAVGVVLMLLAPDTRAGLALLAVAVAVEIVGTLIDRRR
jgi:hypothetical protein